MSRTAWLIVCAALAACQQPESQEPAPPPASAPAAEAPSPPEPAPVPVAPAPPPKPEALASLPPAEFEGDPELLLNLDTAEMADLLGPPVRTEDQPPAIIWVYELDELCTLKVFFYPELEGSRFITLTYEVDPAPDRAAEQFCITSLRRAHVG